LARAWISVVVVVAAVAVCGATAGSAWASFPGRNGSIVYQWRGDATFRGGPYATSVRTVRARGGLVRVIRDCPLLRGGPTTYAPCSIGGPRVSPDGQRVAFSIIQIVVNPPDPWQFQPAVGLVALNGTGLEEQTTEHVYGRVAWAPGGDQLLAERQAIPGIPRATAVFLTSLNGTELGQVTPEFTGSPDWSSTGEIAFARWGTDPDCQFNCLDIWVTRLGEAPRRLTYRGGYSPSWSPHGTKLAFIRAVRGRENVYLIGRDGHGLRRLTRRGGGAPCWSPDGKWVAFTRTGDLYVVRTDGTGRRRVVDGMSDPEFGEGPQVTSIDWQALPRR
jgi:Tol biopolymer transport system component